jgi:Mn-dependent DtxR family transcriptional regulator
MTVEVLRTQVAILDAVEVQRRELRQWTSEEIKKVKDRRDSELLHLDRVVAVFEGNDVCTDTTHGSRVTHSKSASKRRRRKNQTAAMAACERREAVFRYLLEQARPVATGDIRRTLKISDFSIKSALKRLDQEGRVTRTGTGPTTRYEARADSPAVSDLVGSAASSSEQGTAQGRILTVLEDRGSASLGELAQALHAPAEQVRKECGALIREGEIRMARRDGRPVYVRQRAA